VLAASVHCSAAYADFFTQQTIQRFAPLLVIYAGEDNGPASAPWYLDRSSLWFSESAPCTDKEVFPGPWTASAIAKLGLQVPKASRWQYRDKRFPVCKHDGATLFATDHTRPYDSGRPPGLNRDEGFYLAFDQSHGATGGMPFTRDGASHEFKTQAPVYYDDGELLNDDGSDADPRRAYISYWFFYPYNDAPRVPFLFDHQGDWENMSLLFENSSNGSSWTLQAVSYSAHGAPKGVSADCPATTYSSEPLSCQAPRTPWAGVPRLVGFVANGDHATYPSPGPHKLHGPVADRTSSVESGFSWPTWQTLIPLESQGWAGFCGAWGDVAGPFLPSAKDRTGPVGPGCLDRQERQLKPARPKSWGVSRSSPQDRSATPGQATGTDPPELAGGDALGGAGGLRRAKVNRPEITRRLIPFPPKRKRQMAAYSERHYGEHVWRLRHPQVIVEHWAESSSASSVYNTFAADTPDPELHELPNVCAHFVISGSGKIIQLVPLSIRCRHTVGLNWTAIGIEHTGFGDAEVLGDHAQMHASLELTRYLQCRFQIKLRNVIGHNESLSSPFHRERVASLRSQTHGDWRRDSMQIYRRRLDHLGGC
jgi:hypothetical protein